MQKDCQPVRRGDAWCQPMTPEGVLGGVLRPAQAESSPSWASRTEIRAATWLNECASLPTRHWQNPMSVNTGEALPTSWGHSCMLCELVFRHLLSSRDGVR